MADSIWRHGSAHGGRLPLLAGAVVFLACSPVLFFEFAFPDDYRWLAMVQRGGSPIWLSLAEGRPLLGLWFHLSAILAGTIDGFVFLRAFGLLGLAAGAFAFTRVLGRSGFAPGTAAAASVAVFTLPAFQLFASWGTAALEVWAAAAAVAAGALVRRGADAPGSAEAAKSALMAAAVLSAAFLTYQPAALFVVVVAAVQGLADRPDPVRFRRLVILHASVLVVGLFVAFSAQRIGLLFGAGQLPESRMHMAGDPLLKFDWFISTVLPQAFNLWNIRPSASVAAIVFVITASGLWLHFRELPDRATRLLLSVVLLPVAYLPSLVIGESWPSYRSQLALTPLILVYVLIATAAHLKWLRIGGLRTVAAPFALIGAVSAALGVTICFALPLSGELKAMRDYFAARTPPPGTLVVRQARGSDSLAPFVRHDEFGTPATATAWGAEALPYLIRREIDPSLDAATGGVRVVRGAVDHDVDLGEVLRTSGRARRSR